MIKARGWRRISPDGNPYAIESVSIAGNLSSLDVYDDVSVGTVTRSRRTIERMRQKKLTSGQANL
jgi:hypothetical protein